MTKTVPIVNPGSVTWCILFTTHFCIYHYFPNDAISHFMIVADRRVILRYTQKMSLLLWYDFTRKRFTPVEECLRPTGRLRAVVLERSRDLLIAIFFPALLFELKIA